MKISDEARLLISKGKNKEAIDLILNSLYEFKNQIIINEIISLSGRFTKIENEYLNSRLDRQSYSIEQSQITHSVLNILNEIDLELNALKENELELYGEYTEEIRKFISATKKVNTITINEEFKSKRINIINLDNVQFIESILFHKKIISNWSHSLSFRDLKDEKKISNIYIDLDYFLIPKRMQFDKEDTRLIKLEEVFQSTRYHIVVLGQPGAGKTTTMQKIIQSLLNKEKEVLLNFNFPILFRLRELNDKPANTSIVEVLLEILGFKVNDRKNFLKNISAFRRNLINLIDDLKILVVLDGFDELNSKIKEILIKDLKEFGLGLNSARIILTSRTGDYTYKIENFKEFEISPFSNDQIKKFVTNWLNDRDKANDLFSQILSSPFSDTIIRPLTLSHLCAIYERNQKIPDKPKTVYKKIVNLLLEEWDNQRGIIRNSAYSEFEIDRKFDFLTNLSYYLTTTYYKSTFSEIELSKAYLNICENFSLPKEQENEVVNELETHTGIFLQSGYNKFEFAHKSIQEYLTAEYLVKLPAIPIDQNLINLSAELAMAVSISSNSTLYLSSLIFKRLFDDDINIAFVKSFFERLTIEKPDFYSLPLIGVALFSLYTKLLIKFNIVGNKGVDFINEVSEIFVSFISQNKSLVNAVQLINEYYTPDFTHRIESTLLAETGAIYGFDKNIIEKTFFRSLSNNLIIYKEKKINAVSHVGDFMLPKYIICIKSLISIRL